MMTLIKIIFNSSVPTFWKICHISVKNVGWLLVSGAITVCYEKQTDHIKSLYGRN
jgi:thiamine pyrophosphokinase